MNCFWMPNSGYVELCGPHRQALRPKWPWRRMIEAQDLQNAALRSMDAITAYRTLSISELRQLCAGRYPRMYHRSFFPMRASPHPPSYLHPILNSWFISGLGSTWSDGRRHFGQLRLRVLDRSMAQRSEFFTGIPPFNHCRSNLKALQRTDY